MKCRFSITLKQNAQGTLPMPKTIVSDTSCFIVLGKIGKLNLLHHVYGEIITTSLAMGIPESILILDDFKARKIASQLDLKFTGTIGVIIKAK